MDGVGEADDFDWMREPLPERPDLRPLRFWVSEHPISTLTPLVAAFVMLAAIAARQSTRTHWMFVAMLIVWGLVLCSGPGGVVDRIVAWRLRREGLQRSVEPWRHDRVWRERGETRSSLIRIAEALHFAMHRRPYFVVIPIFVTLAGATIGGLWWAPLLALGALITWGASCAWKLHGAGDSHLSFTKFPFHPGETVTMHFGMSEGGARFRRVEFHIYHVEELKRGWLTTQRGTRTSFRGSEHHPPGLLPGPDFDVEVSFDVPADAPGTCLSAKLPSYWVLEVCGVTSAGPYVERFLVPIYDRPPPSDPPAA